MTLWVCVSEYCKKKDRDGESERASGIEGNLAALLLIKSSFFTTCMNLSKSCQPTTLCCRFLERFVELVRAAFTLLC